VEKNKDEEEEVKEEERDGMGWNGMERDENVMENEPRM
jgi:hypothetical protein